MKDVQPLSSTFLAALPTRDGTDSHAHLEQVLADVVALARGAWPAIDAPIDRFLAFLAHRVPSEASPERVLLEMRVADLYLVSACLDRNPRALDAFERHFSREIDVALASVDSSSSRKRRMPFVIFSSSDVKARPRIAVRRARRLP